MNAMTRNTSDTAWNISVCALLWLEMHLLIVVEILSLFAPKFFVLASKTWDMLRKKI
jgi:hypothetical protein